MALADMHEPLNSVVQDSIWILLPGYPTIILEVGRKYGSRYGIKIESNNGLLQLVTMPGRLLFSALSLHAFSTLRFGWPAVTRCPVWYPVSRYICKPTGHSNDHWQVYLTRAGLVPPSAR